MITIIRILCAVVSLLYLLAAAVSYKEGRTDDLIWDMVMAILMVIFSMS